VVAPNASNVRKKKLTGVCPASENKGRPLGHCALLLHQLLHRQLLLLLLLLLLLHYVLINTGAGEDEQQCRRRPSISWSQQIRTSLTAASGAHYAH